MAPVWAPPQAPPRLPLPSAIASARGGRYSVGLAVARRAGGLYHAENDIGGYDAYLGVEGPPDFAAPPATHAAALPFDVSLTPPPSGTRTYYLVVRAKDSYGLRSLNQQAKTFTIDSAGNLVLPPLAAPQYVRAVEKAGQKAQVSAAYRQGDEYPPDGWKVWYGTAEPDTSNPPQAQVAGGSYLSLEIGPLSPGVYWVKVAAYRSADVTTGPAGLAAVGIHAAPDKVEPVLGGAQLP